MALFLTDVDGRDRGFTFTVRESSSSIVTAGKSAVQDDQDARIENGLEKSAAASNGMRVSMPTQKGTV